MKILKRIINSLLFVATLLIFGSLMNSLIKIYLFNNYSISQDSNLLVFGDSHAECAFNDTELNVQNFGYRTETPNFSLLKMNHLFVDVDKTDKKVIIIISPHNISKWHEYRSFRLDTSASRISRFWGIVDNSFIYRDYNELPIKTRMTLHLKKLFGAPNVEGSFKVKNAFKGGYYKNKDTSIVSRFQARKAYERHFGNEYFKFKNEKSLKLIEMYYEIFSFLADKNFQVYVVGTPIQNNYLSLISDEQLINYQDFLNQLKQKYSNIQILELSKLKIPQNYFLDADHLNFEGAEYFTSFIKNEITE